VQESLPALQTRPQLQPGRWLEAWQVAGSLAGGWRPQLQPGRWLETPAAAWQVAGDPSCSLAGGWRPQLLLGEALARAGGPQKGELCPFYGSRLYLALPGIG